MGVLDTLIPRDYLADSRINLSSGQREMAQFILSRVQGLGYGPIVGMAAVANAYGESLLNPEAMVRESTGYYSVGLFQLHTSPAGAGKGYDQNPQALKDPSLNLDVLFEREQRWINEKVATAGTAQNATRAFCIFVERPRGVVIENGVPRAQAEGQAKAEQRVAYCTQLFGDLAVKLSSDLPPPGISPRPFLAAGTVAALAVGGVVALDYLGIPLPGMR